MALAYRLDLDARIVVITGDYAEASEWRDLLQAVASDPAYRPGFSFLRDLRESTHPVDAAAVVRIIAVVRELWSGLGARRAAIVTRREVDVPAMIAHALAEDARLPMRAFSSHADALAWLREP